MYLKAIFLPWLVIRDMGRDLTDLDTQLFNVELRAGRLGRELSTTVADRDKYLTALRRIGLRRNDKGQLEKAVW